MKPISPQLRQRMREMLQTTGNNANPKMAVYSSRAKTTITDGSYWTVETIRATTGLGDVSVAPRRFKAIGRPNRLYEIHVKDGEVSTSFREYPDKLKIGWQPQFTLGPSSTNGGSVAIAFNGYWERYRKLWRLITEEKPWIFWVDSTGVLWRQHWDDISTLVELDTGVSRVRAIRAWKNVNIPDKDQGIVVGYIKTDGTVWYRNYCQQADYSYGWESPKQLTDFTGTAVNLNLFLSNDYRMGFVLEDSAHQIHWFVTPRNWAGMALEQEVVSVDIKTYVDVYPVEYHAVNYDEIVGVSVNTNIGLLFGRTDNSLTELSNVPITRVNEQNEEYQDYGFRFVFKINYPTEKLPSVSIVEADTLTGISLLDVVQISDLEFSVDVNEEVHPFGINVVGGNLIFIVQGMENEAGYSYDLIEQEFTPINLNPPAIPLPEVEVIWNV